LHCGLCGNDALESLCLDHVNGGGRAHLKSVGLYSAKHDKILSGTPFYLWLRRNDYPNNPPLQILCGNCNMKKQISNHEL
jgi:hypothetical protein